MKNWLIRPITFILAIAVGVIAAGLWLIGSSDFDVPPIGSAQEKQESRDKHLTTEKRGVEESEKKDWQDYWPAVVELRGKLGVETFFGPPNFGETPEIDSKDSYWILTLDNPINVRGKTDDDPGLSASFTDVRKLQLVLTEPHRELIGKKVVVKGTLFQANTGHHHTDVLLSVESIQEDMVGPAMLQFSLIP